MLGFSTNIFILDANLATVAPSRILWSAEIEMLMESEGMNLYPSAAVGSSIYLAIFLALPIAIMQT